MTDPRPVVLSDDFLVACAERGLTTYVEIADALGVHRTTVWRAVEQRQPLGHRMLAAVYAEFGAEQASRLLTTAAPAA